MSMCAEWLNGLLTRYSVVRKEKIRDAIFDKDVLVPETEGDITSIVNDITKLGSQFSNTSDEMTLVQLLDRISSDCEEALHTQGLSVNDEPIKSIIAGQSSCLLEVSSQTAAIGLMIRMIDNARAEIGDAKPSRDQAMSLALSLYGIGTLQGHVNMNAVRKPLAVGRKSIDGGVKGRMLPERRDQIEKRHLEIREDGRALLKVGRKRSSLAGILEKRYSNHSVSPKSARQIREILKALDD